MASITVPDIKADWAFFRKVLYVGIITWVVAVRLLHIDPLGLSKALPVAWAFDAISIVAVVLLIWALYDKRPRI